MQVGEQRSVGKKGQPTGCPYMLFLNFRLSRHRFGRGFDGFLIA